MIYSRITERAENYEAEKIALCEYMVKVGGCWSIGCEYCMFDGNCGGLEESVKLAQQYLDEHKVEATVCEFCKKNSGVELQHNGFKMSCYVTNYGYAELQVESPEHENAGDFEIRFCPQCGRKLGEKI